MTALVIVESPAKAKTIEKYLGKGFKVIASYGHVRDLVPKEGAVDPANQFSMRYQTIEKNAKHIAAIANALSHADTLYLATDPDREGEAISWHVQQLMHTEGHLKDKQVFRVVFHEITQSAIREAMKHPRTLSMDLINAQQARRALDYLVGFNLSPLLWKKIRYGLSAGRVQSPALRLIVEREEEIEKFQIQEYWTLAAAFVRGKDGFTARLITFDGKKVDQFQFPNEETANAAKDKILKDTQKTCTITKLDKKQRRRNPPPPFITASLQQDASRKLGFTAQKTMRTAQQLYEGIDVGQGAEGLITYMRTDSVHLAQEAVQEIRDFIQTHLNGAMPEKPRTFQNKSKNAQEAHEAIRPTHASYHPQTLKKHLNDDQMALYELIWRRTVACQMDVAVFDTVSIECSAANHMFRATGSVLKTPGFLELYDDQEDSTDEQAKRLPELALNETLDLQTVDCSQHFTEPPPRFGEASLIKALEEFGIGRPSTYASIIATLQQRQYVSLDQRRFRPTDVGRVVNRFLTQYFHNYVDYDFTARLEDDLDAVARGEKEWVPLLNDFWYPFKTQVDETLVSVKRKDVTHEMIDEACPKCGKPLSKRLGKRGHFIGCTGYPDCDYARALDQTHAEAEAQAEVIQDRSCPQCSGALVFKHSRYGKFIGCQNYPKCRFVESLNKPLDTGVSCCECHQGSMQQRKSRYGKIFYSCSRYPDCKYAVWDQPVNITCPQCHWPMLTLKITKRRGTEHMCPQKNCGYRVAAPEAPAAAE